MNTGQASRTAEYMAFFRALESARAPRKRLFTDSFAMQFLRPGLRRAVYFSRVPVLGALIPRYLDRRVPGARTSGVARTRLIDDAVCQALREGIGQVLILGAGFDCRAYRLLGIGSAAVFEVDHPATLSVKRANLYGALANLPQNVRFVEMDFDRQSLREALTQAGFDPLRPAVFLWEGVTNYLSADAVDAVLRFVAGCGYSSSSGRCGRRRFQSRVRAPGRVRCTCPQFS
jgi:methyltransferase (TIGR00027 family)